MSEETVGKLIELNQEQIKAFKSLQRAVKKCKKANVYFYQVLESLYGLNGNNVEGIENIENTDHFPDCNSAFCLSNYLLPEVKTSCSWADDTHVVVIKQK